MGLMHVTVTLRVPGTRQGGFEGRIEPILGVTALESVGIMLDPTTKTLKRLPAVPLK